MSGSRRLRVLSVAVGVTLLISGVGLLAARAAAPPSLPPVTSQQLIASIVRAAQSSPSISGDVLATLDLGLPSLPEQVRGEASGPLAVLSDLAGTHRLRVWRSKDGLRVAELLPAAERALFVTRSEAWAWDSSSFTAYQLGPVAGQAPARDPLAVPDTPLQLGDPDAAARWALSAITPSTSVSLDPPARVAGRDAYVLALRPRTAATLVGSVRIFVDAQHRIPLALEVVRRGSARPAISVRYTSVSFRPIEPSVFRFTPPDGARVLRPYSEMGHESSGEAGAEPRSSIRPVGPPMVFGSGWATIVAVPLPARAQIDRTDQGAGLTSLLPYSGPLFSVRLEERAGHSWLVAGLVPQASLIRVGPELP
jgi:outer membrane lipoprotein-sorting protein